jgi:hypothetical protein
MALAIRTLLQNDGTALISSSSIITRQTFNAEIHKWLLTSAIGVIAPCVDAIRNLAMTMTIYGLMSEFNK